MLTAQEIKEAGLEIQKGLDAEIQWCVEHLRQPDCESRKYWESEMKRRLLEALEAACGRVEDMVLTFTVKSDGRCAFNMLFDDLRQLGLVHMGRPGVDPPSVSPRSYWIGHQAFLHWLAEYKKASGLDITVSTQRESTHTHALVQVSTVKIRLYKV